MQNNADQDAGHRGREPAERVAEADGAGANMGREDLGLVGVVADGQPGVGPGDHKPADHQQNRVVLQSEQGAEDNGHQRGEDNLPLVFKAMHEAGAEQTAQRIGEGDKEGVQQAMGDAGALTGEQRRQPVAKAEETDRLEEVHHHQHQGALPILRRPDFAEGAAFDDALCRMRMLRRRRQAAAGFHLTHHRMRVIMPPFAFQPAG